MPQTDETIKETFESIVIAFILAFVFRAYVVEAFVIPTGSMAPTLLGAHYRVECEQCGYEFKINYNPRTEGQDAPWRRGAVCPMCRYNIDMRRYARPLPGDRILVHKYIYTVSSPRRWDVVVFKAPHQPKTNFIKRLVGLPNESIRLLDGNVYTQAEGETTWKIARKSDYPKVQRAVWQPIYHSQYVPRDLGRLDGPGERSRANVWQVPWVVESGRWDIEGRRSYRFEGGEGRIRFDFYQRGLRFTVPEVYAYNQYDIPSFNDEIEDIRLAAAIQPESLDTTLRLTTQTRLDGPTQTVWAEVQCNGTIRLMAKDLDTGQEVELKSATTHPMKVGIATPVELWAVDQELSVWIDGRRVLSYPYASELTLDELAQRPPPRRTPEVRIEVEGGPVTLHRVELDRDLYYASGNGLGPARGGMYRDAQGRVVTTDVRPMQLHDDEYFCIGDNNPLSDDGRFWDPDPMRTGNSDHVSADALWVRTRYFGREVTDNLRDGIVPHELMMGRAFFVYFPAPFAWREGGAKVIPNFGDMRFIH
ncbi:MAG: signal peptidase I [Phycisphaeraceae bacterium]